MKLWTHAQQFGFRVFFALFENKLVEGEIYTGSVFKLYFKIFQEKMY